MVKTIMLIDDEIELLKELGSWLHDHGYKVVTASSGKEGLTRLREISPHLIVLDIIMPGMDGFEVLSELKKDPKTSSVPVIMFTAQGETASIMKAQQMRATDYIIKPFDANDLLAMIRRYEN